MQFMFIKYIKKVDKEKSIFIEYKRIYWAIDRSIKNKKIKI